MNAAIELGLLYGVMALGVYLTFRVLNFPDLTVDGSFTTGAAVAASLILQGVPAPVATLAGAASGLVAGTVTGLLYTKGKIDGLLAGILTMIALWSINLRIMGKSNLPLLREETVMTPLRENGLIGGPGAILVFAILVLVIKFAIDWFLSTDRGLAIQATGDNDQMIRSFGVNTDGTTILTLALSNGLVALCGALVAQYQGFADISMGIGLILVGLASVIIGQAILSGRSVMVSTLAVIVGAIVYRLVIFFALAGGLNPNDMKLVTAGLVVAALLLPRWGFLKKLPRLRVGGGRSTFEMPDVAAPASSDAAAAEPELASTASAK
ncbi:ABC transporter permease [Microterricola pindariensis]|uniref:ABC transporter permease n=1 Tax=Microterricola pindariensis TaxID=478010 RepID=A0ABX5AUU7_9MICO|nr:ABC transporter permease [Microterricola pindariensis]PPL18721.1 ABC transporter permease [Microterricola pindariensis]